MNIQVTSSQFPYLFNSITGWKKKLSETDWKTYSIVVLSYLLIGLGMALACGSLYFATVIHPMIATSLPIAPISLGIILFQTNVSVHQIEKEPFRGHPIGIRNDGANCWAITSFLYLFYTIPYPLLIQRLKETPAFFPMMKAVRKYQKELNSLPEISSVNAQILRECMHALNPEISDDVLSQEDPIVLFETFSSETHTFLPLKQKVGNSVNISDTKEFCIPLGIQGGKNFFQLFNEFFREQVSGSSQWIERWFSTAPRDFSIQIKRFGFNKTKAMKLTNSLEVPLYLDLTKDQCPSNPSSYFLDSAIIHLGNSLHSGHYIFLYRKNGRWWKIDDNRVSSMNRNSAAVMLQNAYIVHYTKNNDFIQIS